MKINNELIPSQKNDLTKVDKSINIVKKIISQGNFHIKGLSNTNVVPYRIGKLVDFYNINSNSFLNKTFNIDEIFNLNPWVCNNSYLYIDNPNSPAPNNYFIINVEGKEHYLGCFMDLEKKGEFILGISVDQTYFLFQNEKLVFKIKKNTIDYVAASIYSDSIYPNPSDPEYSIPDWEVKNILKDEFRILFLDSYYINNGNTRKCHTFDFEGNRYIDFDRYSEYDEEISTEQPKNILELKDTFWTMKIDGLYYKEVKKLDFKFYKEIMYKDYPFEKNDLIAILESCNKWMDQSYYKNYKNLNHTITLSEKIIFISGYAELNVKVEFELLKEEGYDGVAGYDGVVGYHIFELFFGYIDVFGNCYWKN
ncbi:hypothetical protein [Algoriphagus sp. A40]|uniref:hypothetical protein n=1 Tax=Algoriphagus sp. A40 TaxID=1945863 RepID=UPI00098573DF|nr:hypothetical protein [Algoriphagus sp. A40]OOG76129.1 hypothetical protein B0E43_08765 [Algoriphagus sp. A40]